MEPANRSFRNRMEKQAGTIVVKLHVTGCVSWSRHHLRWLRGTEPDRADRPDRWDQLDRPDRSFHSLLSLEKMCVCRGRRCQGYALENYAAGHAHVAPHHEGKIKEATACQLEPAK